MVIYKLKSFIIKSVYLKNESNLQLMVRRKFCVIFKFWFNAVLQTQHMPNKYVLDKERDSKREGEEVTEKIIKTTAFLNHPCANMETTTWG